MMKKRMAAVMLGVFLTLYSGSAVFAEAETPATDGGTVSVSVDPAGGSVRGYEGNGVENPVWKLQAEVDRLLFEVHAVKLREKGIFVTHTSPLEEKVEVGIAEYNEADAEFLYDLIGRDKIVVVKGERAFPLDEVIIDDGREPAMPPAAGQGGAAEPRPMPMPMPMPQDPAPDTPVDSGNAANTVTPETVVPDRSVDAGGVIGSSDVIPPAAPALPELALDERLAAESGAAQDLTGASAGTSAPEYADTDEAAELLAASTVSEPAPATGNADNAWNTWLYALLAIAAVVLAVAAGWVYRRRQLAGKE